MTTTGASSGILPFAQGAGVLAALAAAAAMPPREGRVLLLPLTQYAAVRVDRLALDHGALPLVRRGRGLLVEARDGGLRGAALATGVLPVAWNGGSCGSGPAVR
jgi:hypothetical protein